jgi:RNA polymerase primary sigma factor
MGERQMSDLLLDLTDPAVRRMLKAAKKRGYITRHELNEVLPAEKFSSKQIEGAVGQPTEMSIRVVEEGENIEDTQLLELPDPANSNSPPNRDE